MRATWGGPLEASLSVRDRINKGEIPGPTMYMSGPFIQHEPYPGTQEFRWGVKGPEDARAKVQKLAKAGVNCIKLIDQDEMTEAEYMAVVDEAHKNKLKVVAHSHRPDEIRRGMKAGADNFEHTGLAAAPEYPDDIMAMIKERTAKMSLGPLFWTPTVEGLFNYEYVRDNPEALDNTSWHLGLPDSIIQDIKQSLKYPGRLSYFGAQPHPQTHARKENQTTERCWRGAAHWHRQRHPHEVSQSEHVERTRGVGEQVRSRPDVHHPRSHLLAGRDDGRRKRLRHHSRR